MVPSGGEGGDELELASSVLTGADSTLLDARAASASPTVVAGSRQRIEGAAVPRRSSSEVGVARRAARVQMVFPPPPPPTTLAVPSEAAPVLSSPRAREEELVVGVVGVGREGEERR